jgi:hypothetical protein
MQEAAAARLLEAAPHYALATRFERAWYAVHAGTAAGPPLQEANPLGEFFKRVNNIGTKQKYAQGGWVGCICTSLAVQSAEAEERLKFKKLLLLFLNILFGGLAPPRVPKAPFGNG